MDATFPGLGTVINTVGIVAGSLVGIAAGHRLTEGTRRIVTDCLGLVTLLMAAQSAMAVGHRSLVAAVGSAAPILIVLASLLVGGIAGAAIGVEDRLEGLVTTVRARLVGGPASETAPQEAAGPVGEGAACSAGARERFIEGWLTATLLFCIGPLAILGSINDGLGRGIDQLVLKSALDTFAAMAFASTFGIGVAFAAAPVFLVQGAFTLVGYLLGAVMPEAQVMALTATGGLLLVGISLRLLDIRQIRVGDLLPALLVAPLLTTLVAHLR